MNMVENEKSENRKNSVSGKNPDSKKRKLAKFKKWLGVAAVGLAVLGVGAGMGRSCKGTCKKESTVKLMEIKNGDGKCVADENNPSSKNYSPKECQENIYSKITESTPEKVYCGDGILQKKVLVHYDHYTLDGKLYKQYALYSEYPPNSSVGIMINASNYSRRERRTVMKKLKEVFGKHLSLLYNKRRKPTDVLVKRIKLSSKYWLGAKVIAYRNKNGEISMNSSKGEPIVIDYIIRVCEKDYVAQYPEPRKITHKRYTVPVKHNVVEVKPKELPECDDVTKRKIKKSIRRVFSIANGVVGNPVSRITVTINGNKKSVSPTELSRYIKVAPPGNCKVKVTVPRRVK